MVKREAQSLARVSPKRAKSSKSSSLSFNRSKSELIHTYEVRVSDPQSVPLGLTIGPLTTDTGGILIRSIDDDGAARRCCSRIGAGDVIVVVNGVDVQSKPFSQGRDIIVDSTRPVVLVCVSRNAATPASPASAPLAHALNRSASSGNDSSSSLSSLLPSSSSAAQRDARGAAAPLQETHRSRAGHSNAEGAIGHAARQQLRASPRRSRASASRSPHGADDDAASQVQRRNVLIISPFLGDGGKFRGKSVHGGGVAIRYEQFMLALREEGYGVEVLSPDLDNVDVGFFETFQHRSFAVTMATMRQLFKSISACDVIVATDCVALLPAISMALTLGKPFAYNIHTDVVTLFSKWPGFAAVVGTVCYQFMLKITGACAEKVFCVSKNQLDQLHRWGVPCHGVYLPIAWTHDAAWNEPVVSRRTDLRRMLAAPLWDEGEPLRTDADRRTLLLFVGRWNEEKRIDLLARCIPDSCVLCIVGDGPEPFGTTVADLHDPQRTGIVVRRGFVEREKLVDYYQAADFVISASNFETFGNMSYEANLCGTRSLLHPRGGHLSQIAVPLEDDDEVPAHLRLGVNGAFVDFDDEGGPEAVKLRIETAIAETSSLPVHRDSRGATDRDAVRLAIKESITRSGGGIEVGEAVSSSLRSYESPGCLRRAVRRVLSSVMGVTLICFVLAPMWMVVWTLVHMRLIPYSHTLFLSGKGSWMLCGVKLRSLLTIAVLIASVVAALNREAIQIVVTNYLE